MTRWAKPTSAIRSHAVFGGMGICAQLEFVVQPIMEDDLSQRVLSVFPSACFDCGGGRSGEERVQYNVPSARRVRHNPQLGAAVVWLCLHSDHSNARRGRRNDGHSPKRLIDIRVP